MAGSKVVASLMVALALAGCEADPGEDGEGGEVVGRAELALGPVSCSADSTPLPSGVSPAGEPHTVLPRDVPALAPSQRTGNITGLVRSILETLESPELAASSVAVCIQSPRLPGCETLRNQLYPLDELLAYGSGLPRRLQRVFSEAAAWGWVSATPTIRNQVKWTALNFLLGQVIRRGLNALLGSDNVKVFTSLEYVVWHAAAPFEEATTVVGRWVGGATQNSPATYQTLAPTTSMDEIAARGARAYCTMREAQRRRARVDFKKYSISIDDLFDAPVLEFAPMFTMEQSAVRTSTTSCAARGLMNGGRQGLRVRLFGADLGDLSGSWAAALAEDDRIEGKSPRAHYRRVCDDSGRNCRSVLSNADTEQVRRTGQAQSWDGSAAKLGLQVDVPIGEIYGQKVYMDLSYRARYGMPAQVAQTRGFPPRFAGTWQPGDPRRVYQPLALPARGLTYQNGAFLVSRQELFANPAATLPQEGRGQAFPGESRGGLARIGANDDRTLRFTSAADLAIGLSSEFAGRWIGLMIGGDIGLGPEGSLELREQYLGLDVAGQSKPNRHVTALELTPSAKLAVIATLWADVWIKIPLGIFDYEWRHRILEARTTVADDRTPSPTAEVDRMRLTTWSDRMSTATHQSQPEWTSHFPQGAGAAVETFSTPDDLDACLAAPRLQTPVPPAQPGTCPGTTPGFHLDACVPSTLFEPTQCNGWTGLTSTAAQALFQRRVQALAVSDLAGQRAVLTDAQTWFVCHGLSSGESRWGSGPLVRHVREATQADLAVLLNIAARVRARANNLDPTNPANEAFLESGLDIYLKGIMKACGAQGRPLGPTLSPPRLDSSNQPICG